jgi:tetratricopeptide (TPR) repeat protein
LEQIGVQAAFHGLVAQSFLSRLGRCLEAIPLRRRELSWCREEYGDDDQDTLASINGLAIDLREVGAFEEAESLFCELVFRCQKVLQISDHRIGRALAGLGKTLEAAGRYEEALPYVQQALAHRLEHEGADAWISNRKRLDLAQLLHGLGRIDEAKSLVIEVQQSICGLDDPDDQDRELFSEACNLFIAY